MSIPEKGIRLKPRIDLQLFNIGYNLVFYIKLYTILTNPQEFEA